MKYLILLILGSVIFACSESKTDRSANIEKPVDRLLFPADGKKVVLISGDEEYRSEEALPQLAAILSKRHGFDCTVLFAQDPEHPGKVDPNYLENIPGLSALEEADLMVIFTRFRALPDDQMAFIDSYLKSGKPVIGIRTATHAFNFKDSTSTYFHYGNFYKRDNDPWHEGFGRAILGEKWISHHGWHKQQSTVGYIAEGAEAHPVLNGIGDGDIWGPTDVYGVRLPLPGDTEVLVNGQVTDRSGDFDENDLFFGMDPTDSVPTLQNGSGDRAYDPNDPIMPIAWIRTYSVSGGSEGTALASTIGASSDMVNEAVRRMYVNAAYYLTGQDVPEQADVGLLGDYQPTQFNFHTDEYWDEKDLRILELDSIYNGGGK